MEEHAYMTKMREYPPGKKMNYGQQERMSYSKLPHAMHHWSSHALCLLMGKCIEIIVQAIDPLEKSCGWISLSSLQLC